MPAAQTPEGKATRTTAQFNVRGGSDSLMRMLFSVRDAAMSSGWGTAPPAGFHVWRAIRNNPTVNLGRVAALAPVKMAMGRATLRAVDDGYADEAKAIWPELAMVFRRWVQHAATGLDYGFAASEIVWGPKRVGGMTLEWPVEIKPLAPEVTSPNVDAHGRLEGLTNLGVRLGIEDVVWYSNEPEFGDPWGTSRAESVRQIWHAWNRALARLGQYAAKVAGVTPIVEFPEGKSGDENGTPQDNYDLACAIVSMLEQGSGVVMPNILANFYADLAANGVRLAPGDLKAWNIRFLETASGHGADMVAILTQLDKFLVRGYCVPERAVLEGEHGTKADSEVHADITLQQGEDVAYAMGDTFDRAVIQQIAVRNWGADADGVVRLHVPTLQDEAARLARAVVRAVLTTPATLETYGRIVDLDAMIEQQGIPVRAENDPARDDPPELEPEEPMEGEDVDELSRVARGFRRLRVGLPRTRVG